MPFRWFFSWRIMRRCLIGLAGFVTLIAIIWVIENIRGKRAWEDYKHELEAKGEKFDLQTGIPAPVPDDENFAMTPFLAPLFDFNPQPLKPGQSLYRDTNALHEDFGLPGGVKYPGTWTRGEFINFKSYLLAIQKNKQNAPVLESTAERKTDAVEILQNIEKFGPVLDELEKASQRPYARFNIHYQDSNPFMILLPHLAVVKRAAITYQVRASAELALGKTDLALKDIRVTLYLADTVKEPFLISGLVRIAIFQLALQPVWEGLAAHQWSDAQLAGLEKSFEKFDELADYSWQLRGERSFNFIGMDYLKKGGAQDAFTDFNTWQSHVHFPAGWIDRNKLAFAYVYQSSLLPAVDDSKHRVYASQFTKDFKDSKHEIDNWFMPYRIWASLTVPAYGRLPIKYATTQNRLDQATIACALERYRLAHGRYPESLDELTPQFIDRIPSDLFSGEPLKYDRGHAGQFTLYSIGWNEKDDGGTIAYANKDKDLDLTQGDWVWPQYPQN